MTKNIFNTVTVENASIVLNNLKSLNRPLTAEEKALGTKAARLYGDGLKNKVKEAQEVDIKFYTDRGYSLGEARTQVVLTLRLMLNTSDSVFLRNVVSVIVRRCCAPWQNKL